MKQTKTTAGSILRPNVDFLFWLTQSKIEGHGCENKFGRNIEIDSGVSADIWDGGHTVASGGVSLIWVAPTQARIHTIASDSVNDDTGGTGANSVKIYYLPDWDTKETSETVTGDLNAGIAMTNAAVIINRMHVIPQATSTSPNVGTITATAATDATISAQIRPTIGQTAMAIYGIPSTQDLYFTGYYVSMNKSGGATGSIDASLLVNPNPNTQLLSFLHRHTLAVISTGSSHLSHPFLPYNKVPGPAIVKMHGHSGTNDIDLSSGFSLITVDK